MNSEPLVFSVGQRPGTKPVYSVPLSEIPVVDAPQKQSKDIPDRPILQFLCDHKGEFCNWSGGNEFDVHHAMPSGTPNKLALAKMGMLIRRGLVSGCTCGCSGTFEITPEGEAYLRDRNP